MAVILTNKNLSEVVRATRKKAGLSQVELAELAGVGKTLVFNVENGRINAQFENLLRIFHVLNIKLTIETP
ncbi:MAG: helix-turn-helix domain-containing protein [Bdellovibrionota bacterium]